MNRGRVFRGRLGAGALALGIAALAVTSGAGVLDTKAAPSFNAPSWTMQIGQPGSAFVYPWGMTWDPTSNTIITSDYNNYNVKRFSPAGALVATYSSKAALGGSQPYGVAVDPVTGNFVVDNLEGYLRYSSTGNLINTVSTQPEHAFYAPFIGISPTNETVYVVQSTGLDLSGANVVLMYDKNDNFKGEFGTNGRSCSSGQFGLIRGVDIDSSGNVYINDVSNHCVEVFSGTGTFEHSISTNAHLSNNTRGLSVDRANNMVYIADAANQYVGVYSTSGAFKGTIGTPGTDCGGNGQLDGPRDMAISPDGTVYVSDYTCFTIDAYNPLFASTNPGGFLGPIPNPPVAPPQGGLNQAVGVAVSPVDGTVYVSDTFNQRIQEFQGISGGSPAAFVQMWGSRQPVLNSYCAMDYPRGVAVDPANGNLWVNDTRSGWIKAYTPNGNGNGQLGCASPSSGSVSSFAEFGGQVQTGSCIKCSPGKFFYSRGIFVGGPSDNVYVTDSSNGRLQVLSQSGNEVSGFPVACGTTISNPAGYNGCTGVTVDSSGTIYAVSINQDRVDVFSPGGKLLRTISGNLGQPFDDALSPDGSVLYVTDVKNNRVSEFNPSTGNFLGSFGSQGTTHGRFSQPMGIDVDGAGNIYVNDYGNNRIEVFTPA